MRAPLLLGLTLGLAAFLCAASTDTPVSHPAKPASKSSAGHKKKIVLNMPPPSTAHGQVLSPGQKPPSTTLAESEKIAGSTTTHP